MNKGKKRSRALLAGLLLAPGVAAAIGVGPIQVQSGLGQRLRAQVELLSVAPDELQNLSVRLAPPQAFAQAGLDRTGALSDLQFAVEAQPGGRSVIRITSQRPVREPALNFLVELGSPRGKLMREFAILLDPVRPNERRATAASPIGGYAGQPSAGGGTYGPIRPGETLWSIADRLRPADMSNREAVRRLYDANPEAFSRRSPDGLRAGAMLRMPAESGWQGNPPAPAVPAPAQPLPVTPPAVATRPPASPAPATAKPPEMPPAGAQVRLLPPEGQSGGNALPAPGMGMTDQPRGPDPVAGGGYGQIELDNGRLRLQAAGLDHLQNRIDTLPAAERVPVPVTPPAAEPARPAAVTPPQPTPAPVPAPVAARPPVKPAPEPDFLDSVLLAFEDPLVLAGLGVAVAALLGGGLLAMRRARRAQDAEHEMFESITLAEDHVAPGAAPLPAAAGAAAASADPLERSSLLMSLGNHAEARALLESALAAAPDNTALRMRLLEVLHTLRDAAAFRREVGPLRQLVYGDTDPMWLRVARMGRELCPDDPMFIGTVAATPPGMPATSPRMPVTPMPAPASAAAAAPARMDDEVWSDLDFKPMDMPEAAPAAAVAPKAPAVAPARLPPAAVVPPGPSLDFEPVEVRRPAEKPAPVPVPAPATTPEDLLADLGWSDADLGAPPAMPEKPVTATPAPRPAEVADLDFGDDLAAFLPPRQTSTPAQAAAKPVAVDPATAELADDLGFSFQPVSAPAPAPLPVVPAPVAAPPVPASTADTRGEDEFVETKLDLALAYIDMDDPLGAKSLLEEVLQEGGSSQRSRAQALLERLAS